MTDNVQLFIDGAWVHASDGTTVDLVNPANNQVIGQVAVATDADIDWALHAAKSGFGIWRKTSAWDRAEILCKAARLIDDRKEDIALKLTAEQGKPIAEARGELSRCAETFEWCAAEAIRSYGRMYPQRRPSGRQMTIKEPVGPVAAFTPWNFPVVLSCRKLAAALGAGCSIILNPPNEAPSAVSDIIRALHDAGVPNGAIGQLTGNPAHLSERQVNAPEIAKVSLTGSVRVGKLLGQLAGAQLKPVTMELGGHAPVVVFSDADIERAAALTADFKYRNAGQVCLGVSRIFVQESAFDAFYAAFAKHVEALKVGDGMAPSTTMGPMTNESRVKAMEQIVDDAVKHGATVTHGGKRYEGGCFFEPTLIRDVPDNALLMTEEPFGPVTPIVSFTTYAEVLARANALPYGLAAYAFTNSLKIATDIANDFEAGWVGINEFSPALAEAPFCGFKDSGLGAEGGPEGFDAYLKIKFISQLAV
ncbi:NAD-dependent succinate-semialdehyde dehydrogenase [uncultured Tateyamaria sp.]|uniref:NAD-dependent succinate-semialdehyde dehydrogenase n=1 Tax=uncultured Tateyamaria sp. TaxID=455651 RepID=UPI002603C6A6|nr:NAD-dependent succinate-semialdehyde dehydrogenase [uncultured Tateyamaria sp.]